MTQATETEHLNAEMFKTSLIDKVLIVDDSLTERARLNSMLTGLGYNVIEANDGREALEILSNETINLVVSDQVMPGMDGRSLCKHLRSNHRYGSPYVIMLTAQEDASELVACMDAGADDFLRKPAQKEELRVRLASGARLISMRTNIEKQNANLSATVEALKSANQQHADDMAFATRLQEEYVPESQWLSPTMELAAHFDTATGVGGDSMGFMKTNRGQFLLYQVDVMGHGIASAMLSFTLQNSIRQMLGYYIYQDGLPPLHQIVRRLNERFPSERFSGLYFTLLLAKIDEETDSLYYCQAGHPHPCVVSPEGNILQSNRGSFPVGMFDFADFETRSLPFPAGSMLLMSSDGLFDIVDANDAALGRSTVESMLNEHRTLDAKTILDKVTTYAQDWSSKAALDDDVSVMLIKRNDPEQSTAQDISKNPFTFCFNPTETEVESVLDRIYRHLTLQRVDLMICTKLRTALAELLNNFVEHANWPVESGPCPIDLRLTISTSWIVIEIDEFSAELPHLCPPKTFDDDALSGRGQTIMMSWIDHINCERSNGMNQWRLRFKNT